MQRAILSIVLVLATSGAFAAKNQGTLAAISDSGVFKIGYHSNSPPFSFLDDSGGPVGYSVDLCRRIGVAVKEAVGRKDMKVEFVPLELKSRIKAVEKGKVDIVCGSDTITLSRQERVDFTLMTFVTGGALLSRSAAPVKSTSDLSGKTVAVAKGTTTASGLQKYLESNLIDAKVLEVDSDDRAMGSLAKGEVDAIASDQIVLIGQVIQSGDPESFTISQDLFSFEPYGLMVRRNDADFRLVVNRALSSLYRTAQYQQLYERWFGRAGVRPTPILAAMYQLQALPE